MIRAVALVAMFAAAAHADPLELGFQLGMPGHGSGVPVMEGQQLAFGLSARLPLPPRRWATPAVDLTLGTPIAGVGLSLWGGLELRREVAPWLSLYTMLGMRTGFAGPLYYARHSDVFVGYGYIYSGSWTIGPHVPLGVATTFGRVNAYVEAFAEAPLLPSPQLLFGAAAGVRVSL